MRIFGSVVQVAAGPVFHIGQNGAPRNTIAVQTIGDQALRFVLQALQQAKTAIVAQRLGLSDAQKAQAKALRLRTAASVLARSRSAGVSANHKLGSPT